MIYLYQLHSKNWARFIHNLYTLLYNAAVCAQSCLTLCDMDWSPPGSFIHGILQARIVELSCPPPGHLPDPGIEPTPLAFPALAGMFFTSWATREAHILLFRIKLYSITKKKKKKEARYILKFVPILSTLIWSTIRVVVVECMDV